MGVDSTNVASGRGRNSVRITSKKSYNAGSLIILDLSHMPGNACGTWPAFWTVGPSWPSNGEIDIIEGVNSQSTNHYAVHTGAGCSISNTGLFTGSIETQNCDVNDASQPNNAGCSIVTSDGSSYGDGFNAVQGGVYATEFTTSAVSIWFFPRSSIPADITSGWPNPSTWGKPHASFGSPCNIGNFVKQQQIVFDTTFCGDWAGSVWSTDATCSSKANTCQDFVQNNPSAFKDSYWSINSLKVYSGSGSGGGQPGGSASYSQRPTVSGGIPTGTGWAGQPAAVSSGIPAQSSWAAAPASAQQSWGAGAGADGANGNRYTKSAWDGNGYQAPNSAANNVVAAPSSAAAAGNGGQFYDAGTGVVAAAPAANTAAPAAPTGATPNTNTQDETLNNYKNNAVKVPVNNVADTTPAKDNTNGAGSVKNVAAPEADQEQDIPSGSPSVTARPSRTMVAPWMRHSWSGRYVTVTAVAKGGFGGVRRDVGELIAVGDEPTGVEVTDDNDADVQDEDELKKREIEAAESLRRRNEKLAARSTQEDRGEHLHGHQRRHRHGVGRRSAGWLR